MWNNVIGDKGDGYLIVPGTVINEKMNMINIYAPNDDNTKFFEKSVFNHFFPAG